MTPGKSIHALIDLIARLPIQVVPENVEDDIQSLRVAYSDDDHFCQALTAIGHEIIVALRDPQQYGKALGHAYEGWRRSKFQSEKESKREADLRLIFRATSGGIEVRAFGHRRLPNTVYFRGRKR